MPPAPDLPDGLVAVVKRSCPTCEMIAPVLAQVADAGAELTVVSQDDAIQAIARALRAWDTDATLAALAQGMPTDRFILLTTVGAATQRLPARAVISEASFTARVGDRIDEARRVYQESSAGVGIIEDLIATHGLDCDWEPVGSMRAALTARSQQRRRWPCRATAGAAGRWSSGAGTWARCRNRRNPGRSSDQARP